MITVPLGSGRAEINAALAVDDVQLEAGVYTIETPPPVPRRPWAMLAVGRRRLTGAGKGATVLRFTGDVGGRDWWGIEVTDGAVSDLTIDTTPLVGAIEQTHCIRGNGPSNGLTIANVGFVHPSGGDGIQLVGYPTSMITGVTIQDCDFLRCARSGIAAHSGTDGVDILRCKFVCDGQDVDQEGSGGHKSWRILGCEFGLSSSAKSAVGIQLHRVDGVRIAMCRMAGRGLFLLSASHVYIDGCRVHQLIGASGTGVIEIDKASHDCSIYGTTVIRHDGVAAGPLVRTMPRDGVAPDRLLIQNCSLIQGTGSGHIEASGGDGLTVANTTMAGGTRYAILAQGAVGLRCDAVVVADCSFVGPMLGCLGTSGSYGGAGSFDLRGNVAIGPQHGIVVGNGFSGTIVDDGNFWPPPIGWSPP